MQGHRAQVEADGRSRPVGQGGVMLAAKTLTPFDVYIRFRLFGAANLDQFFLQQLLHLHTGPVGGLIDQRGIQQAHLDLTQ